MAPFPQDKRIRNKRDADRLPSRWPLFAAALLIAALFGLLSGVVRDAQFPRGIQSADRSSDAPHLSKREPLRAIVSADRKDSAGAHWQTGDGALVPRSLEIAFPLFASLLAPGSSSGPATLSFWPGSLPRAPPAHA